MSAVTFAGLGKQYAGADALHSLSAELPVAAVTALIGRSGSGKSTLLRTVNGLCRPDRGEVRVFGTAIDYADLPALRRRIGYLVQGTGLFPHLDVAANICLLARLEGWSGQRCSRRLEQLLAMTQLDAALAGRYPHELSGGQQQRVGLCRAMMLNPPLLLLDEPFAALDPLTRMELHEQLLALQDIEPRSIILVTHDMREALRLADLIVVLEAGAILHRCSRAELLQQSAGLEPEQLLLKLLRAAA